MTRGDRSTTGLYARDFGERPSSARITAFVAALAASAALLPATPRPVNAQDSLRTTTLDSLAERLRRAEEAIQLLRDQLATEAESKVQTSSRVRLDLFGRVLMNAFHNGAAVSNSDVPFIVLPQGTGGGGLGATVRQTSIGGTVTIERVLGARFEGELHTDFFGGQQPSIGGRRFPLLRIRTASGTLRWARAEMLVGQADPLVAGVNPRSLAAFGTPEFTAAGNLWLWQPQIRGTWTLHAPTGLAVQAAVLAPGSGDPAEAFDTRHDAAERTERPSLQARLRARWGEQDRAGEVGIGVHRGWLLNARDERLPSEAIVLDAVLPLTSLVELRGEAYVGQAIRGLGGGGVAQGITTGGEPVRDRGGWLQVEVMPTTLVSFGGGCGISDPRDDGALAPAGRLRNRICEAHLTARPDGPVVVSLGWREMRTRYAAAERANGHVNLAFGFEY